jgi:hypothetical protein
LGVPLEFQHTEWAETGFSGSNGGVSGLDQSSRLQEAGFLTTTFKRSPIVQCSSRG